MLKIGDLTDTADGSGEWTDGSVAGNIQPTEMMAAWFTTVQREIIAVLTEAGIQPDKANDAQLITAIKVILQKGIDGSGYLLSKNNLSDLADMAESRGHLGLGTLATKNSLTAADVGALPSGGTAVAATKLATARTIAGVAFDGTANIAISAGNVGAYTKAEGDNKYQPKGSYTPAGQAYTKAESDGRYPLKSAVVTQIRLGAQTQHGSGDYLANFQAASTRVFTGKGSDSGQGDARRQWWYTRPLQVLINGSWVAASANG